MFLVKLNIFKTITLLCNGLVTKKIKWWFTMYRNINYYYDKVVGFVFSKINGIGSKLLKNYDTQKDDVKCHEI